MPGAGPLGLFGRCCEASVRPAGSPRVTGDAFIPSPAIWGETLRIVPQFPKL